MMSRRYTSPVLPLLALGVTLALATPTHAQDRRDYGSRGTTASLRVSFGSQPHWTTVQGTRVEELPYAERPGYDMFRYGGRYYAYDNNRWYASPQENGDYVAIDDASVPGDFEGIPSDHWRNYPSGWQGRRSSQPQGMSGTLHVDLGNSPQWTGIRGTSVREMRPSQQRPDYDVFAYGGSYYVYDNNRWYTSRQRNGEFTWIDDRDVPQEFTGIPRSHWRNDPSGWQSRRHRRPAGSSATLQINFGYAPHWTNVRGTSIREIRRGERPDYDIFGYGGSYYVYRDSRWYSSNRSSWEFNSIDDRSVPSAFSRIPRSHWRNYPTEWSVR